ncbi:hypothetical protein T4D_5535 [Trichinella pseudospiralis]|uniref:Uncharacterized protein n=1 Tax=Trichinella pseudospiralis TaxID=6337 RepID=A0A0V1FKV0_TRIPS|nr:hypothetical protein T4D_5535 [Trichinella pseudospiralis]
MVELQNISIKSSSGKVALQTGVSLRQHRSASIYSRHLLQTGQLVQTSASMLAQFNTARE